MFRILVKLKGALSPVRLSVSVWTQSFAPDRLELCQSSLQCWVVPDSASGHAFRWHLCPCAHPTHREFLALAQGAPAHRHVSQPRPGSALPGPMLRLARRGTRSPGLGGMHPQPVLLLLGRLDRNKCLHTYMCKTHTCTHMHMCMFIHTHLYPFFFTSCVFVLKSVSSY